MRHLRNIVGAIVALAASTALAQAPAFPYAGQTAVFPAAPIDTPLLSATQPRFVNPLPIPVDFTPDTTTYPGWDYYEIAMAPVTGTAPFLSVGAPAGTQWLGLVDATAGFCAAPAPANTACSATTLCPAAAVCTPNVLSPLYKLYTPVWGYGQVNMTGGPLGGAASYPAMNIRGTKGTPIKVKWINNAPDQHLFCPQPLNSNWPCAIDRTLMGTKADSASALTPLYGPVNQFGSPQQPDNAMVVHFHGGEIPPNSDGFAELWFGNGPNAATGSIGSAAAYSPGGVARPIDPPIPGLPLNLVRPVGNSMLYNYPMVNEAATLWYHDHALGKTRINVAAGPAGFFNIKDPADTVAPLLPTGPYEINIVFQDRDFNAPQPNSNLATINFPNGMNQVIPAALPGQGPLTPGGNAAVHPQWVPEYFGTFPIVNGMAYPVLDVEPRKYLFHFLDGSNARCWNFQRSDLALLTVVGNDQGYLAAPVAVQKLVMCPGERYDVVLDFTGLAAGTLVTLTNNAPAPFPKGISPKAADLANVMQFRVGAVVTTPDLPLPLTLTAPIAPLVATPAAPVREMVLNEVLDALTLYPLKVQIDGTPFEGAVTETPTKGTTELWNIINTTGDAHPIHLHLVRFQIVSRQIFDLNKYSVATGFAIPGNEVFTKLPIAPYLKNKPRLPPAYEAGWKDTAISYPGEVLTLIANWDGKWNTDVAMQPFQNEPCTTNPVTLVTTCGYQGNTPALAPAVTSPAFLPVTSGPYVWHCHIVDHEDNEMMRPVMVQ